MELINNKMYVPTPLHTRTRILQGMETEKSFMLSSIAFFMYTYRQDLFLKIFQNSEMSNDYFFYILLLFQSIVR